MHGKLKGENKENQELQPLAIPFDQMKQSYPLNDYLSDKLKFKYLITKDGLVFCQQYNKLRELNYTIDRETEEIFIYVLKNGAPNKADMATLQKFSLKLSLEEFYDKIYGEGTFRKYALKNVCKKIQKSQELWKEKKMKELNKKK